MNRSTMIVADRYELDQLLGRGGMGEVWAARDLRLQRDVAVKLLSPETVGRPDVRQRFDIEARAAASLTHPNIVLVYDSGEHEGRPYVVMERLAGRTLADEIADGPLAPDRARTVATDVLAALGAAHAAGIVHRDVKPANVLLCPDGSVKVADFGIAKTTSGPDLTTGEVVLGTPGYLAPERLTGQAATVSTDLYAVGVLLYEALTGRRPFEGGPPMAVVRAIQNDRAQPLSELCPGIPSELAAAVERAMDKDPARRFASASAMGEALDRAPARPLARSTGRPSAPPRTDRLRPLARTRRWRPVAAVVALFVVAIVVGPRQSVPESLGPSGALPSAQALPAGADVVPPARYQTTQLVPRVEFTLDPGWTRAEGEADDVLALRRTEAPATGTELSFLAVERVFRADRAYTSAQEYVAPDAATPALPGLVDWLQRHPRLRVTEPAPAVVGGMAALRFDVEATDAYRSEACGEPCVLLFQLNAEPGKFRVVTLQQGKRMRLYLMEHGGRPFVLSIVAPAQGFEAAVSAVESVVKSVTLKG